MNIFITGHKGLIGTSLKKRLVDDGHKIIGAIDLRENNRNLSNLRNLRSKIKIDMFIHAAALCKINKTVKDPPLAHVNNSAGTFHALEFCRINKIPKFVFFSSSRVLSKEKNPYTASKLYGEELCKAYSDSYGIEYLILRPSTVYGGFWDITSRLIHLYITAALAGKELKVYGNPKIKTLDFTHVDDFVDGTMLAINYEKWNKEYNISGGEEYKVQSLAEDIIKQTGSTSKIGVYDAETAQPQKVKLDILGIKKLGYTPKIPLKEGVEKTIKWYVEFFKRNPHALETIKRSK